MVNTRTGNMSLKLPWSVQAQEGLQQSQYRPVKAVAGPYVSKAVPAFVYVG